MDEGAIPDDADIVDVLRIRSAGSWTIDARTLLEAAADELERLRHELKLLQDMRGIDIKSFHAMRRELNRLRDLLVRADERTSRLCEHVLVHHGALCPLQTECPL